MNPNSNQQVTPNESMTRNKFEVTNINKAKKDQAFVFYRPKVNKTQKKEK